MKLPRTIRFDQSDTRIFERAAEPDEWAVSGAVLFADVPPAGVTGKLRQAFANGFLGTASLGHATCVVVATAGDDCADTIARELAQHFVERLGAPGFETALGAARAEVGFAVDLCRDLAVGSVLAVSRSFEPDGTIAEQFRVVQSQAEPGHDVRIWSGADDA